jgi:hypothetical protein
MGSTFDVMPDRLEIPLLTLDVAGQGNFASFDEAKAGLLASLQEALDRLQAEIERVKGCNSFRDYQETRP